MAGITVATSSVVLSSTPEIPKTLSGVLSVILILFGGKNHVSCKRDQSHQSFPCHPNQMKTFLTVLVSLLVIDGLYLSWSVPNFYMKEFGSLMRPDVDIMVGSLAWLALALGSVVLVQRHSRDWKEAAFKGAILGGVTYT